MGTYISIRGWIECREEQITLIREVIALFVSKAERYGFDAQCAAMYNQGWVIPETHINWTHYIFYGADIRIQRLDYVRDQLKTLSHDVVWTEEDETGYLAGIFHADHDEGTERYIWTLANGQFHEVATFTSPRVVLSCHRVQSAEIGQ